MSNSTKLPSFEFRRRNDTTVYRYHPCESMNGFPAWKRENIELYVTKLDGFGWVCVDKTNTIHAIAWGISVNQISALPTAGEWVSKKGDKSYVYDVVYI